MRIFSFEGALFFWHILLHKNSTADAVAISGGEGGTYSSMISHGTDYILNS